MRPKFYTILAAFLTVAALIPATTFAAPMPIAPTAVPQLIPSAGVAHPSRTGATNMLMIGDSLTAGITAMLPRYLPGWKLGINGVGGRPLDEGMGILSSYALPKNTVLSMGLFTNDLPTRVWALKQAVRESLRRVGPNGCVIWATIYRPAVGGPSWYGALPGDQRPRPAFPQSARGISYRAANAMLRHLVAENRNMRLVHWAESLRRHPVKMDRTLVHPATTAGWQRRAQMFADAAKTC